METTIGYLRWRGDLTFKERPFNEVDNLIFCLLAYPTQRLLASTDELTIRDAYDRYTTHEHSYYDDFYSEAFVEAAKTARFKDLLLSDYTDCMDKEKNLQFAAMCFHLPGNVHYVAFRGTDFTLTGWKEDFYLSFQIVEAQKMAASYLEAMMKKYRGKFYVGGHSKGGNLAVYAAAMVGKRYQNRILRVYSNDGPGFSPDIIAPDLFSDIAEKIYRIGPEYSVIGNIFYDTPANEIVKSTLSGAKQHAGASWCVERDHFVTADSYDPGATTINTIIDEWLVNQDDEQRKIFIHDLFATLEATGTQEFGMPAENIGEQPKGIAKVQNSFNILERVLKTMSSSDDSSKESFKELLRTASKVIRDSAMKEFFNVTKKK
ncbi:MAG: DUF2974 domain-containing protein [Lachnospiraceae bacterium]|nr:DUF2974 domain-containing protein [Lachnospiraceae bacterium]